MTTTDLSKFGYREKKEAANLLLAMCEKGLPIDFYDDEVTVMMNQNSGNVFLTNSDYQVAMLDGEGNLQSFYNSPYEGKEGFFEDLLSEYIDMHPEDQKWFKELAESLGREDELPQSEEE